MTVNEIIEQVAYAIKHEHDLLVTEIKLTWVTTTRLNGIQHHILDNISIEAKALANRT